MIPLSFRPSSLDDIAFYASFFNDERWMLNSGFRKEDFARESQLEFFLTCHHPLELKGFVIDSVTKEGLGFAHFKHIGNNDLELTGGIRPDLLNKGMGLLCLVFAIDYLFKSRSVNKVYTLIYQKNSRSSRVDTKIGFRKTGKIVKYDVRLFDEYVLTSDEFYDNTFNRQFLIRNGLLRATV